MTLLAHPLPSRQDLNYFPSASSSPTTPQSHIKSHSQPSRHHNSKTLHPTFDSQYLQSSTDSYYLDSRQSTPSDQFNYGFAESQFMQNSSSHYPEVRVQQSTPNNGLPPATPPPLVSDEFDIPDHSWNFQGASYLAPSVQQQFTPSSYRTHKRLSSGSSIGSTGPESPYTQSPTYPEIVDPDNAQLETLEGGFPALGTYPKQQFPPSTQHSDSSFYPTFQNFNITGNDAASMTHAQSQARGGMNHSGRLGMNGGQGASRESFSGEGDASSETQNSHIPHLDRTMSDIYQDELFNPAMSQTSTTSQPRVSTGSQAHPPSAHRSAFNNLLQAANNGHLSARSASPVTNASSRRSPFRDTSSFGFHSNPSSPAARLNSAAQIREQQKIEADAQAYAQHHSPSRHDFMNPPKTISPKEAVLDYHESDEDAKIPLFPSQTPNQQHLNRGNSENSTDQTFGSLATSRCESSSNYPTSPGQHQSNPNFTFMPPSVPQIPQQYPFISQSRRQSSSMQSGSDQIPEFPASLTSMESTKSESGPSENFRIVPEHVSPPSSQEAIAQRPIDTSAGSGSYTCTSSDCHARFDNAAKLHKHRREAHRTSPSTTSTPTTPSSATTPSYNQQAAANNVSRNNQPGPHKCEKTNPSTGKPCNTIFSRSYDLTRHEDTIHNNRKQKVRCHLCTEEKTFSRNDALTRHMRVVHPDVDFPGKTRRGRNNDGVDVVRQKIERGGR